MDEGKRGQNRPTTSIVTGNNRAEGSVGIDANVRGENPISGSGSQGCA